MIQNNEFTQKIKKTLIILKKITIAYNYLKFVKKIDSK